MKRGGGNTIAKWGVSCKDLFMATKMWISNGGYSKV